ncbi:hemerythrin domain-containing protein [Sulfobacillus harzensis]|uniref:Hemerythrin-like domain-containing protein n=1 Tax=Sulfobacillus harzensis TaxID=2729629 RepID=A0A7Y0L7Q7_9FIRM|nr:hemerythrin domain-containing protein [Sulfobacillus harzensis]NMP23970.1 hypothetical protein [Sulfobacillus harzensis]
MSGPALRQVTSHRAIHENAWHEVQEALKMAEALLFRDDRERFAEVAEVFLEVAEARVLVHAHEEETGLYLEWIEVNPDIHPRIKTLKHEHRALRRFATDLEEAMVNGRHQAALDSMREFAATLKSHSAHEEGILTEVVDAKGRVSL